MRRIAGAVMFALVGCAAAPPPAAPPPPVLLQVDQQASFVEATASTRIALLGPGWGLQAHLPLDAVPWFRADTPVLEVHLKAESATFFPGPALPEFRPSAGPPTPPPWLDNPDYTPPPEVQIPEVWVRLKRLRGAKDGEPSLEVTLSEFTVDGRVHQLAKPAHLEVRGPYP